MPPKTSAKKRLRKFIVPAIILVILFIIPVAVRQPYYIHVLNIAFIYVLVVSSLRTISLSGQISVAHAAFMGVGAYSSGVLAIQSGLSPYITIPLGGVAAAIVAVLIGYPFARVRAIYFAMISLFGGIAIVNLIRVLQKWTGATGLTGIPPLDPINLGFVQINFAGDKVANYYFILIVLLICLWLLYRIENSRIGMTWKSIAQSYMVASSVGINERRYRVLALAVGCFFAGIAGGCYAHYNLVITPTTFGFLPSISLVMYMLVGGTGSFYGPIIGTGILVMTPEVFRWMKAYAPLIVGGIMVIVVFLMPEGIIGLVNQIKVKTRKTDRAGEAKIDA